MSQPQRERRNRPTALLRLCAALFVICSGSGSRASAQSATPFPTPNQATAKSVTLAPYADTWSFAQQRWWDISSHNSGADYYNQFNAWTYAFDNAAQEYTSPDFHYNNQQVTLTYDSAPGVPYFVGHVDASGLKP